MAEEQKGEDRLSNRARPVSMLARRASPLTKSGPNCSCVSATTYERAAGAAALSYVVERTAS